MSGSRWAAFWKEFTSRRLPSIRAKWAAALPTILAGIKTSISTGWMVVLAAEMLGAKSGVGFLITRGMDSGDTALVLVAMIAIGIVGALLAVFISFVERMICPWLRKK